MRAAALFFCVLFVVCTARALVVEGYDSEVNDRFRSGYPKAPVLNESPRFVGKGFDWSGVGWIVKEPTHSVALISPRHFVYAKHLSPGIGDEIAFVNRDGKVRTFTIAKLQEIQFFKEGAPTKYADTAVGTLSEPVAKADHIAHYRVANFGTTISGYIGKKILLYGHLARIGTNEIVEGTMLRGAMSEFNFYTTALSRGMAKPESGDSGSPTFLPVNGELTIVGTHREVDTDSMVPGLIPEINRILAQDGSALEVLDATRQ